ncbi:hypothetical protein [uncultured Fibrobacter sp.]|uniref:hypothetical protein n=1 Tax=uncultured Fibrobacter sp. TaxID=261512 RepID=UPI0025F079E5|nr:hypothetical protein [uncultured Fibrobacter sp.]
MKCDELKAYKGDVTIPVYGTIADAEVYLKKNADAAIATLRGANDEKSERIVELQKQVDELKAKLNESEEARYEAGADAADYYQENRKLKRALYKACANWALSTLAWLDCIDQGEPRKWSEMRQKCLKKAEEYK